MLSCLSYGLHLFIWENKRGIWLSLWHHLRHDMIRRNSCPNVFLVLNIKFWILNGFPCINKCAIHLLIRRLFITTLSWKVETAIKQPTFFPSTFLSFIAPLKIFKEKNFLSFFSSFCHFFHPQPSLCSLLASRVIMYEHGHKNCRTQTHKLGASFCSKIQT